MRRRNNEAGARPHRTASGQAELEEAARWKVLFTSGACPEAVRALHGAWLRSAPGHREAWRTVERVWRALGPALRQPATRGGARP